MFATHSPGPKPPTWTWAPYGQDANGDCVLLSSDSIRFKTLEVFLSYGSSVLAKRVKPQPSAKPNGDLPVIPLDEDSTTVRVLLDILTPSGELPQLKNVELAIKVVTACQKYAIAIDRVNASLQSLMEQPENFRWSADKGLQIYALSWKMGLERAIKKASRYTHRYDLSDKKLVSTLLKLSGDTAALLALHDLRLRRTEAIFNMILKLKIQSHICSAHERGLTGYNEAAELEAIRKKLATALEAAYPSCDVSFFSYLGIATAKPPPSAPVFGFTPCTCFASMNEVAATKLLRKLVDEFPQEVDSPKFMKNFT